MPRVSVLEELGFSADLGQPGLLTECVQGPDNMPSPDPRVVSRTAEHLQNILASEPQHCLIF